MKYRLYLSALVCGLFMSGNVAANDYLPQTNYDQPMSTFEQNQRNAEQVYERQQQTQERANYDRYLQENDRQNGVSQRTGVTGGRTDDGGFWGGYQWSIE